HRPRCSAGPGVPIVWGRGSLPRGAPPTTTARNGCGIASLRTPAARTWGFVCGSAEHVVEVVDPRTWHDCPFLRERVPRRLRAVAGTSSTPTPCTRSLRSASLATIVLDDA